MTSNYTPRRERAPIEPHEKFGPIKSFTVGESTEIAIWRNEYNGTRQVSLAQKHPFKTGGHWKSGVGNLDPAMSEAVAELSLGWTIGVESPVVEAPKRTARGRKAN